MHFWMMRLTLCYFTSDGQNVFDIFVSFTNVITYTYNCSNSAKLRLLQIDGHGRSTIRKLVDRTTRRVGSSGAAPFTLPCRAVVRCRTLRRWVIYLSMNGRIENLPCSWTVTQTSCLFLVVTKCLHMRLVLALCLWKINRSSQKIKWNFKALSKAVPTKTCQSSKYSLKNRPM